MGRVALLVGAALCACSSVVRAPALLRVPTQGEARRAAPKEALTDAELQAFITQRLGELSEALEPLCGPGCRSLTAQPDREIDATAALRFRSSPSEFVVLYRADEFRGMVAYRESLAMYSLAHELGHYVDIAIAGSDLDDRWRLELSADVVAGCAFELLGLRRELVRALIVASSPPADSIDSRLDLVCGSDREHPALRWSLEAFDIGVRLCHDGVAPLERLETEVTDLRRDAKRAAEKTRAWFRPIIDPCRWRHLGEKSFQQPVP
jgi:hypothetical protein